MSEAHGFATQWQAAGLARSSIEPQVVKACCAALYGLDLVPLVLGQSYHPGGVSLTRRLADALELRPGEPVVDLASGIGTTALLLAEEHQVEVLGVDLGPAQVERSRARAKAAGAQDRVRFALGDAERLPVGDGAFAAAVCECSFCTFPNKAAGAAELARVLRPGGRVGVSDVWVDPDRLDQGLRGLAGRVACLADARPIEETAALLEAVGLEVTTVERHDDALVETAERVEASLRALKMVDLPFLRSVNLDRGVALARRAIEAIASGHAGYMLIVARRQ